MCVYMSLDSAPLSACICLPACKVFLKVINAYCPKDLCEIAM